jgi:hypothetical protein
MTTTDNIRTLSEAERDYLVDSMWDHWAAYVKTIDGNEKIFTFLGAPWNNMTEQYLADQLHTSTTKIQSHVQKICDGFVAYLKIQGFGASLGLRWDSDL